MKITVLGAGYMGTAMAVVAQQRGHEVRLWGTWLDDDLIEACERKAPHPRLKLVVDLPTYRSARLAEALAGAELVIHGVNSDGAVPVMTRAAPALPDVPILSVSKGFLESGSGRMDRLDLVVSEKVGRPLRFVHAAGPAEAVEIARRAHLDDLRRAGRRRLPRRDERRPHAHRRDRRSRRRGGLLRAQERLATGLGLWDGLVGVDAQRRAACFTQSIVEMRAIVHAAAAATRRCTAPPGSATCT
ncbi:MAG: hypothetical protein IPJ34_07480 [Myxococcales bacterium]|nr:hypothetical protein [Myxococcales bacterium]